MKSLADLRNSKPPEPRRPERSLTLCLAPDLVAESQSLQTELETLTARPDAPRKMSQGPDPRVDEIRERQVAVFAEMAEHDGEMRLRANLSNGEWRRWCNAHPARDEDEAGRERDQRVTFGYCNADDLLDNLGAFVHRWNGDPCGDAEWRDLIEPNAYPGDLADMARLVVEMYEAGSADFRQRRNVLLGSLKRLNGSALLATSEPATSDSTDGNPEPSSGDSTETDSPAP